MAASASLLPVLVSGPASSSAPVPQQPGSCPLVCTGGPSLSARGLCLTHSPLRVGPSSCIPRYFPIPSYRMCFFSHFTQL